MRPSLLPLTTLLLLAVGAAAWGLPGAPRFAVVLASAAREGKGQLGRLEEGAGAEGFLDRVLGTNCFSQAVAQLTADCRRLGQEQKTRLALHLMNCQLGVQGGDTYPCPPRASLKDCTAALSERAHSLFVEFLTHADTMCLFIQNQEFERYTENMLNRLAEGAGFAKQQLAAVAKATGALAGDTAALGKKAQAALDLLRRHGELEEEALKLQKKARAEAAAYFQTLDAKQQLGLELQESALQKQAALEAGQAAALTQLAAARQGISGVFDLVEGRAAELAAAAAAQADAQRALAGELAALAGSSAGIRSAVDVVIGYQQRSDSVLMRLLGKSYSLEDIAFYAATGLAAMAAGASPATAKAKLPVLGLVGASLVAERLLVDHLHLWLDVDDRNQIVLNLPLPAWLPRALLPSTVPSLDGLAGAAPALQLNLKWSVRKAALALGACVALYCLLTYRDYERESYRLLRCLDEERRRLEAEQQRRHEELLAAMRKQRIELAAMLGGAGPSAGLEGSPQHAADAPAKRGRRGRLGQAEDPADAAQQQQQQDGNPPCGGRLALLRGGSGLASVPEEVEEESEGGQQAERHEPITPAAGRGRAAMPAPSAVQPRRGARAAPKSAMLQRVAAAKPAASKRAATDAAEAAGTAGAAAQGAKLRAAGGRRPGMLTEDTEAVTDSMACNGSAKPQAKRPRRGSAESGATAGTGGAAKRARRR